MTLQRQALVTGANGFIGQALVKALKANPAFAPYRFVLNDLTFAAPESDDRFRQVAGDFAAPEIGDALLGGDFDLVFHIGGILGGAAETDYATARRVNVDGTLSLLEALGRPDNPPRFVFASSIAVFGPPLPALIDDATEPHPLMNYGAHKRMAEIAIEHFSRRGWIDGIALRLPGIVARPNADTRLKSAFLSMLFEHVREGRDVTLPVSPGGTTWLLSARGCVDALLHAALLPADRLTGRRAFTLPAQRVTFAELAEAVKACCPDSASRISFDPDPAMDAQFGSQPPLTTACADALGFRHDGTVASLVENAFEALSPS